MLDIIKSDLYNIDSWSYIYELDESEKDKLDTVRDYLKEDYGYLDIVLDKDDFETIIQATEIQITDQTNSKMRLLIIRNELQNVILSKIGINIEDASLFSLDYDLKEKAKEANKEKYRLHIFLDEINDALLQECINDYITLNHVIAYTTKNLLTIYNTSGQIIEETHDYILVKSEIKNMKDKQRYRQFTL